MPAKYIEDQVKRKKRRMNKAIKLLKAINLTPLSARTLADILTYRSDNYSIYEQEELLGTFRHILMEMK